MSGTKEGGLAAARTNKELYGDDFYAKMGEKGGAVKHPETRYWHNNKEAARIAGMKGGRKSRRKPRAWTGDE